ncbi:hypothetical protein [Dyadobacter psychrophilus]|uniref:DUF1574 domain-containing protein n=1 Tax=Dyadobacter psychrophilus TaxID=651661 RepID=A0A1T5GK75_9BACT|nr:hypothetical protein [Dyadobacter psychrophilus]SKC08815.1 hypothetical protein SAMN05660293_04053 [Dyadobacter psychrophilus]
MVKKILLWIVLFLAFKLTLVSLVGLLAVDPRRDIATRKQHCDAFHPNAVFIGTSRTLYGVDPEVFDSLNAGKTNSYNMGLFSLSFANSLHIARDFIQNNPETKTIFVELSALDYSTIHLTPGQVFNDVYFRMRVMQAAANIDKHEKWNDFLTGLNTTIFQTFSIAPQIAAVKKTFKPVNDPIEGPPNLAKNGMQRVALRISGLNSVVINNRFYTKKLMSSEEKSPPNIYFLSRIKEVITIARTSGKQVIFYMPNNITKTEFEILSQVARHIPPANFIALPKDSGLDAIFKPENLFDSHHLNAKGSAIYTRYLQEQFTKKSDNF